MSIYHYESWDQIDRFFTVGSNNNLVVVDLDDTIYTSDQNSSSGIPGRSELTRGLKKDYREEVETKLLDKIASLGKILSKVSLRDIISPMSEDYPAQRLMEEKIPSIIRSLKNRNIFVLGFTAGRYGITGGNLGQEKKNLIEREGIHFSDFSDIEFPNLSKETEGLLVCEYKDSKGDILNNFIKAVQEKRNILFTQIIFIDNLESNVDDVAKKVNNAVGIVYEGIHKQLLSTSETADRIGAYIEKNIDKFCISKKL